ncbi:putative quinol monooxygenase [Vibrio paucivorans]
MVHLIAEIKAAQGQEQKVEQLLTELLTPTREENGCCQYELYKDQNIDGLFIMQEIWCSQESLDVHLQSEHLTAFSAQCKEQELLEYVQMRPLSFIG